jgi:hypothetical protein
LRPVTLARATHFKQLCPLKVGAKQLRRKVGAKHIEALIGLAAMCGAVTVACAGVRVFSRPCDCSGVRVFLGPATVPTVVHKRQLQQPEIHAPIAAGEPKKQTKQKQLSDTATLQ